MAAVRPQVHELQVFREELRALPAEVQDVHLSWISLGSRAKAEAEAKAKAKAMPKRRHRTAYLATNGLTTSDEENLEILRGRATGAGGGLQHFRGRAG